MDYFGSNASPMGGSSGRADAMVAAVGAQKAEGVLHIHAFIYVQMVTQFDTLAQLASKIRQGLVSAAAMKEYVSYTRCASYPNVNQFQSERDKVEKQWPAHAQDLSLSRCPAFFGTVYPQRDLNGKQDMKTDYNILFPA